MLEPRGFSRDGTYEVIIDTTQPAIVPGALVNAVSDGVQEGAQRLVAAGIKRLPVRPVARSLLGRAAGVVGMALEYVFPGEPMDFIVVRRRKRNGESVTYNIKV